MASILRPVNSNLNLPQLEVRRASVMERIDSQNLVLGMSPEKVRMHMQIAGSGTLFFTATILFGAPILQLIGITSPLFFAMGFITIAIGIFLTNMQFNDYHNPLQLRAFREDIKVRFHNLKFLSEGAKDLQKELAARGAEVEKELTSLIQNTAQIHGWENLFRFGIILPTDMIEMFSTAAQRMELNEIISLYETINKNYEKAKNTLRDDLFTYFIPSPKIWKDKFFQEVQDLPLRKIIKKYNLEKLRAYEIITEAQFRRLSEFKNAYEVARASYHAQTQMHRFYYLNLKKNLEKEHQTQLEEAKQHFSHHSLKQKMNDYFDNYLIEIDDYRKNKENELRACKEEFLHYQTSLVDPIRESMELFISDEIELIKKEQTRKYQTKCAEIEQKYKPIFDQIAQNYKFLTLSYLGPLSSLQNLTKRNIAQIEEAHKRNKDELKESFVNMTPSGIHAAYKEAVRRLEEAHAPVLNLLLGRLS